jgi:hypothetical protein
MYGPHLCHEYIKHVDAFIGFRKKDILDNITRMRRDIIQIMCSGHN